MKLKKNIYLMYAIVLLQGMVFYGPIATLYRQANGLSVFQITLIESISYLLCILFEVPWGIVADKIGYRKTMCFCCGLYFVSKLVFWQAGGFSGFLLERIMLSIVVAGLSGVDTSVLYLSCDEGQSHRVFGIYNGLGVAGFLIASFIFSAFVGDHYRLASFFTVISYGIAAILSLFLSEVKKKEKNESHLADFRQILSRTLKNRRLILLLISVAFLTQTTQTICVFLNQVQYEKCGMSPSAIGYVCILVTLAELTGVFSDRFTKKAGVKTAGSIILFIAVICCVLLALTGNAIISVCGVLVLNMTYSFFQPLQTELQNRQVRSHNRATELSIYAMIIDSICAGTSVIFGALTKISLESAFFFGGGICLTGLILFRIWHRSHSNS